MAIIDIGSNSVKLYLQKSGQKYIEITQLSQGLAKNGRISAAAAKRTAQSVLRFCDLAKNGGERVFIYATEAARHPGSNLLTALIEADTGVKTDILDDETEALCGFWGAYPNGFCGTLAVLDIGGASTEITIGNSNQIKYKNSFKIGTVRFRETTFSEPQNIDGYIAGLIETKIGSFYHFDRLIAIGGTATSLAAIKLDLKKYDHTAITNAILTFADVANIYELLSKMTTEEILLRYPFLGKRVAVITYGTRLLLEFMRALGTSDAYISDSGTIEGYIKLKSLASSYIL